MINPDNPNTLYTVVFRQGVFKSADAGATWASVGPGLEGLAINKIVLDPVNRTVLYAATAGGGIMKITQRR